MASGINWLLRRTVRCGCAALLSTAQQLLASACRH